MGRKRMPSSKRTQREWRKKISAAQPGGCLPDGEARRTFLGLSLEKCFWYLRLSGTYLQRGLRFERFGQKLIYRSAAELVFFTTETQRHRDTETQRHREIQVNTV